MPQPTTKSPVFELDLFGRRRRFYAEFTRYTNNEALAVILMEADSEERYCDVSANMPDASDKLPDDVFYLRCWSEHAPVAAALIQAGLVTPALGIPRAHSGFVEAQAYRWHSQPLPCPHCAGTGEEPGAPADPRWDGLTDCPDCKGTGVLNPPPIAIPA